MRVALKRLFVALDTPINDRDPYDEDLKPFPYVNGGLFQGEVEIPNFLGPGVKTGLNIMMDNPGQLGADQVADAVAGIAGYPVPLILIDMGTATTASVVNSKKQYVGGMILPGVGVSLDALTARASQLSGISIDAPRHVIGKNTIECMKSGVLYSNAAALDGIIDRIEEELGEKATVVATGGLAKKIVPHCKREIILDEELLLRGLLIIYEKNK